MKRLMEDIKLFGKKSIVNICWKRKSSKRNFHFNKALRCSTLMGKRILRLRLFSKIAKQLDKKYFTNYSTKIISNHNARFHHFLEELSMSFFRVDSSGSACICTAAICNSTLWQAQQQQMGALS